MVLQWLVEKEDVKTRVECLFRHCQDQASKVRSFSRQQLETMGATRVEETLAPDELRRGMRGLLQGLERDDETSRFAVEVVRRRMETMAEERGIHLLGLSHTALYDLIADVVMDLSEGQGAPFWRSFLFRHHFLLTITSSNPWVVS